MNTVDLLIGGKGGPLEVRLLGGNLMRLTRVSRILCKRGEC
jgi:hypothetical protein